MKTIPLTMRMYVSWIEYLKRVAREEAVKQDKDISYLDLIREAIGEKYPKINK